MATLYHAVPGDDVTVLAQIGSQIFGHNILFYILQISTSVILVMAANTSYAGLPLLLSLAARDGYVPKQFNTRGGRLSYSNGIIMLGIAAGVLVVLYKGETHRLVPLYAVGVFISFTLSQLGMFRLWLKTREPGWRRRAVINGIGLLTTSLTVLIIAYSKLKEGAWNTLVRIAVLIYLMKVTHKHYLNLSGQLTLHPGEVRQETESIQVKKHVIVLVDFLNKASLRAINYARQLAEGQDIVAFHVSIDSEEAKRLEEKWQACQVPVPLVVKYSPYREIMEPLIDYVESEEHDYQPGDMLTVVMPQFVVDKAWMNIYHNQTAFKIRQKLLHDRHIAVVTVPFVLDK
jgi:hypothetical protein